MTEMPNPDDYIITRKRKLYKFALFQTMTNCYDDQSWGEAKSKIVTKSPLIAEVGAGSGLFLTKLASLHPDKHYLAIDRKSDRLVQGAKKAVTDKVVNINYLWSNADNLGRLLPAGCVDEIWLTFPDPWPQESNYRKRLTAPKYLSQYEKLLAVDGVLRFKTDNKELFDWSKEQLATNGYKVVFSTDNLHGDNRLATDNDALVMTSYEARYIKEGKKICYLVAKAN